MKLPKERNRYCPKCKKHTPHSITTAKQRGRSTARPLSRGSRSRAEARGLGVGYGNQGKRSKPAVKAWKRKTKVTRRMTLMYKCSECGKYKQASRSIRSGRIEIGDKVAK